MMQNKMTAPPLQGISNLMKMQGRMGDTELVHMTKPEVKGLASLGVLTTNPNTGLPEAFLGSLGGFFRDFVAPVAIGAISGPAAPYTVAGYQMAKTGAMGGNFIDAATAGLLSFAGGKLGQNIGKGLSGVTDAAGAGAGTSAAADAIQQGYTQGLSEAGTANVIRPDLVSEGIKNTATGAIVGGGPLSPALGATGDIVTRGVTDGVAPSLMDRIGGAIVDAIPKTPEGIGRAVGTGLGGLASDIMLQEKLQSENIPKEVKDAETVQQEFSTGKLQNLNPQYADRDLSASRIVGAMQGTQAPLQFTDPSYSPAVTGNLSSILGAKNGGGLEDALESITEGAEKIADMGEGQVYFEGMVKGDGDGMSDDIPFSIENKQPALLSRDEYVLPADVVSALGNGSSNAGADMLDKFMTDVREKSMGRERQINQIG
tara:strand:- start:1106 stop:2392 length:1287 start_codon:yes stop_codon:yes gene_type:complete